VYYNAGLYSYAVLYNLLMLKLYKNNFTSPDRSFYSYLLSGIKSAIGCERVIPRSDVKLLDPHVWLEMSSVNPRLHNVNPRLNSGYLCRGRSEMKCE